MHLTCVISRVILKKMCLMVSTDVLQACHLKKETVTYEEKEQQLVKDCVKELREYLHIGQSLLQCILGLPRLMHAMLNLIQDIL